MQQLSESGRIAVTDIANRHGFSIDATTTMLRAVVAGGGMQAQFSHPEFGGMGQWSSGGMVMIGDMFNNALAGRVAALCQDLGQLVQSQTAFAAPAQSQSQSQGGGGSYQSQGSGWAGGGFGGNSSLFVPDPSANWWPADLGQPGSTGAQNNLRYAYFPNAQRLAIDVNGQVTVYDTGNHQIGGFGQQQSGDQSITFTSQFGTVRVADLPVISPISSPSPQDIEPSFANEPTPGPSPVQSAGPAAGPAPNTDEIFALIEKLADLHAKGVLTDAEFETKKSELLGRL